MKEAVVTFSVWWLCPSCQWINHSDVCMNEQSKWLVPDELDCMNKDCRERCKVAGYRMGNWNPVAMQTNEGAT